MLGDRVVQVNEVNLEGLTIGNGFYVPVPGFSKEQIKSYARRITERIARETGFLSSPRLYKDDIYITIIGKEYAGGKHARM